MNKEKLRKIPQAIEDELSDIIIPIAKEYNIPAYVENPDFLEERLYSWHQFGLLAHTKKVRNIFLKESQEILYKWSVNDRIKQVLSEEIEGIEKKLLLEISIPFHDLGKIIALGEEETDRDHEKLSVYLVNQEFLKGKLYSSGLADAHIKYISRCIETHDVIGKEIRDVLKHQGKLNPEGLSQNYAVNLCTEVSNKYPDINFEIGVYFLCDSLGKTDIRLDESENELEKILSKRQLPPQLKKAVLQLPVNLKLAEIYLLNLCR